MESRSNVGPAAALRPYFTLDLGVSTRYRRRTTRPPTYPQPHRTRTLHAPRAHRGRAPPARARARAAKTARARRPGAGAA